MLLWKWEFKSPLSKRNLYHFTDSITKIKKIHLWRDLLPTHTWGWAWRDHQRPVYCHYIYPWFSPCSEMRQVNCDICKVVSHSVLLNIWICNLFEFDMKIQRKLVRKHRYATWHVDRDLFITRDSQRRNWLVRRQWGTRRVSLKPSMKSLICRVS